MNTSELMQAMADLGAPLDAIILAVRALDERDAAIRDRDAASAEKRAQDAARKREERAIQRQSKDSPRTTDGRGADAKIPPPNDIYSNPPEPISAKADIPPLAERVVQAWNDGPAKRGATKSLKLTPKRAAGLRARVKEHGEEAVFRAIAAVAASDWHCGHGSADWRADIGWLLTGPEAFQKMLERDAAHPAKPIVAYPPEYTAAVIALTAERERTGMDMGEYIRRSRELRVEFGVDDDPRPRPPPERRNGSAKPINAILAFNLDNIGRRSLAEQRGEAAE